MQPLRRQPTRLSHPWDSPCKNTGVEWIATSISSWSYRPRNLWPQSLLENCSTHDPGDRWKLIQMKEIGQKCSSLDCTQISKSIFSRWYLKTDNFTKTVIKFLRNLKYKASLRTKLAEVMELQLSYFKSWKMMLWKCCTQYASKYGKLSSGPMIGKGQFSFQSPKKPMPKNAQTTALLHSSHTLVK